MPDDMTVFSLVRPTVEDMEDYGKPQETDYVEGANN